MRIRLAVLEGPDAGTTFEFEGYQSFVLGREGDIDRDLRLPTDPYFSRHHLLLEFSGDGCLVRDLQSRNGVYVNGGRIGLARLANGDLLKAGRTTMRILIDDGHPAPVSPPEAEPEAARRSRSEFEVIEEIGAGAVGVVYRARDLVRGGEVAIKVLRPERALERDAIRHFVREMRIGCHLSHPHVLRVLAAGFDEGDLWIAMDLVDGVNVEEQVELDGPLQVSDATSICVQLLEALEYAHGLGVIHRDVKPANVMLLGSPGRFDVRLGDFGLAKSLQEAGGSRVSWTGVPKGTPSFMAPEQVLNAKRATPAADVFGVGSTLYWALTLAWHFEGPGEDGNLWSALLEAPFVPLKSRRPEVPAGLARVLDRSLDRSLDRRYRSATEMLEDLRSPAGAGAGLPEAGV